MSDKRNVFRAHWHDDGGGRWALLRDSDNMCIALAYSDGSWRAVRMRDGTQGSSSRHPRGKSPRDFQCRLARSRAMKCLRRMGCKVTLTAVRKEDVK